jgi:hypothetical protein
MPQASPILPNKSNLLNQTSGAAVSPQLQGMQRPSQALNKPLVGPGGQKLTGGNQVNALNRPNALTPQQQQQKGLNSSPATSVASPSSAFNATPNNLQQNRSANNNSPFNSISNNKSKYFLIYFVLSLGLSIKVDWRIAMNLGNFTNASRSI